MAERKLTERQLETLRAVRDGEVSVCEDYIFAVGARLDVFGRLEERGLVVVDWFAPVRLRRHPRARVPCKAMLTKAGETALAEAAREELGYG